jgi:hypothetical protein
MITAKRGATRVQRQVNKLLDYNKFGLHFRQTLINASILETTSTISSVTITRSEFTSEISAYQFSSST